MFVCVCLCVCVSVSLCDDEELSVYSLQSTVYSVSWECTLQQDTSSRVVE